MIFQANTTPEPSADPRLYLAGQLLLFTGYCPDETAYVPAHTFVPGDVLRVLPGNGCGMGIDVERCRDGQVDMVWPNEVTLFWGPLARRPPRGNR